MSSAVEKVVEALELMPEETQESAAKRFRALKDAIDEGMADMEAGRVLPWDLNEFLKEAHAPAQAQR